MKHNNIFLGLAAVFSLLAASCSTAELKEPYPRNVGEEYLTVSEESMEFPGRGGSQSFTIEASYDGIIAAGAEWIGITAAEFPGDTRTYTVKVNVPVNKTGADRTSEITISTRSLTKVITIGQPKYDRPDIPNPIKSAEDLVLFLENAPYVEENEVFTIDQKIDLKDVTLPSAEYFNGILDGQSSIISNLKSGTSLFAKLTEKAVVKNIVFDASCEFEIPAATSAFGIVASENEGTVEKCVNEGAITVVGDRTATLNAGAFVARNRATGKISGCRNNGAITFNPSSCTATAYLGGIAAQNNDGTIESCEVSGSIYADPSDMTGTYNIGGIVAGVNADKSTSAGTIRNCIVHKDADIYVGEKSGTSKGYIGSALGRVEGHPVMSAIETYADVTVLINREYYIGALQAWQGAVDDGTNYTFFENSIVNSNITAYTKGKGQYGNNPCLSAGFVTGRFSGQSGKSSTLHYGNAENPIKVSGSITSLQTGTKVVATSKDFAALLDGDGSKTSANTGAIPETDYDTIKYEVVGDGQTGPAEELILTIDGLKLEVPMAGGKTSFMFKANYDAVVTAQAEWLYLDENDETVRTLNLPVADSKQTVDVFALENPTTMDRSGKVSVELPNGSYGDVEIFQPGNKDLPAELEVSLTEVEADPAGCTVGVTVTANYDAEISTDCDWITFNPATVPGDYKANTIELTIAKNNGVSAADRIGTVSVKVKDIVKTITVSQAKFVYVPKAEIATVADFLDFVEYASDPELYVAGTTYKLTADIDLKGKTIKPISTFVAIFDGQGHSLKNWACDGPLFANLNGEGAAVRNLVIDASCAAKLKFENATKNGSNYCLGVICGDLLKGTIEGCTNNAKVELATNGTGTEPIFLGAIAGRSTASMFVKGCVNNGAVTLKTASAVSAGYRVAGIVGGSNGNVENCTNNAPVELSPADITGGSYFVGGIVAYFAKNADQTCTGCINTVNGKVTFNPAAVTTLAQSYVGGVAGYLDGQLKEATNFSNVTNFGDVYSSANDELVAVGGLLGWSKAGGNPNTFLWNSVVNCNVTAGFKSADDSAVNPCQSAGLVIGRVAMKNGAANVTAVIGTAEQPVKVAGSVTLLGGTTVTADSSNYKDIIAGSGLSDTGNKITFNTVYEAVTRQ